MNRKQAEKLIGTRVHAWTSANGEYVGELVQVKPGAKWRGVVRIDGIMVPPVTFEFGRRYPRRGFRVGELIEVGHSSITPTEAYGVTDYLSILEGQAADFRQKHEDYLAGKFGNPNDPVCVQNYAWYAAGAKMVEQAIEIERQRLAELDRAPDADDANDAKPGM